ncbi:MAG: hypothetical protein AB4290_05795 [Spirulina sp.]
MYSDTLQPVYDMLEHFQNAFIIVFLGCGLWIAWKCKSLGISLICALIFTAIFLFLGYIFSRFAPDPSVLWESLRNYQIALWIGCLLGICMTKLRLY